MMRKVFENEIHGLDFKTMLSLDYLVEHVSFTKKDLCKAIHHVDTQLRKDGDTMYWRVQGYINISEFKAVSKFSCNELDALIKIGPDALEIYSWVIPFKG